MSFVFIKLRIINQIEQNLFVFHLMLLLCVLKNYSIDNGVVK
jgi:hypothetical protein